MPKVQHGVHFEVGGSGKETTIVQEAHEPTNTSKQFMMNMQLYSLVPRPSRGRREKAWYRQHAHAPTSPRFWGTRLRTDTVGYLYCKLLVF